MGFEVIDVLADMLGTTAVSYTHLAVCNLETIMGNTDTPVRAVFDYIEEHFLKQAPLMYIPVSYTHLDVYKRQGSGGVLTN